MNGSGNLLFSTLCFTKIRTHLKWNTQIRTNGEVQYTDLKWYENSLEIVILVSLLYDRCVSNIVLWNFTWTKGKLSHISVLRMCSAIILFLKILWENTSIKLLAQSINSLKSFVISFTFSLDSQIFYVFVLLTIHLKCTLEATGKWH